MQRRDHGFPARVSRAAQPPGGRGDDDGQRRGADSESEGTGQGALTRRALPSNVRETQVPFCQRCKGAGYIRADVPFGHVLFGKAVVCECRKAIQRAQRQQDLLACSALGAQELLGSTFDTFNARMPGVREAFGQAQQFAAAPQGWLLLVGGNGCGKTHLALAIMQVCLQHDLTVLFAVVPDLLDHLRAAFHPKAEETYDERFVKLREADVLILDDLGAQQQSAWAMEKLYQLVNYRYMRKLPTVVTTNPEGLERMDPRIHSRLGDGALVKRVSMQAKDYRLYKRASSAGAESSNEG